MISANQKPHSKSFRRVVLIARIAARCPPSGDLDQGTNCRGRFPQSLWGSGVFACLFFVRRSRLFVFAWRIRTPLGHGSGHFTWIIKSIL